MIAIVVSILAVVLVILLVQFGSARNAPALHETQFRSFKLVEKKPVNHNSAIYRFALPTKDSVLGLPTGQHVSVAADIRGRQIIRSYTPISNDRLKGYVDLLVKTYPDGNISKHFSELEIGQSALIRGPKGAFNYQPNTFDHLSMVAGGSGVTPMYQILQAIAENTEDKTKATLIFANVTEADIFLRKELDGFAAARPGQINVHYVLNNPPDNWMGSTGFVTSDILAAQLPTPAEDRKLLLCGPFPMTSAVKKAAVELGWEKAKAPSKMADQVFVF